MFIYFLLNTKQTFQTWEQTSSTCHSLWPSWGLEFVVGSPELFTQPHAVPFWLLSRRLDVGSGCGLCFQEQRLLLSSFTAWRQGSGIALTRSSTFVPSRWPRAFALGQLGQENPNGQEQLHFIVSWVLETFQSQVEGWDTQPFLQLFDLRIIKVAKDLWDHQVQLLTLHCQDHH